MSETAISNVRKRTRLLRHRARLLIAWAELFPAHDFTTARPKPEQITSIVDAAWADPGWARAAGRPAVIEIEPERLTLLRRLLDDNISLERAWSMLNDPSGRPTPQVTVETILHCVRERGLAALKEPANLERLARCDAAAKSEIDRRIGKLIGHHV
jgi:hypothetical protein